MSILGFKKLGILLGIAKSVCALIILVKYDKVSNGGFRRI
jgi:hypothetical protein